MLSWADRFSIFCFLNGNGYEQSFPLVLAVGAKRSLHLQPGSAFSDLKKFYDEQPSWLFGHLGYQLTAETQGISMKHNGSSFFSPGFFFEPQIIIRVENNYVSILSDTDPQNIRNEISNQEINTATHTPVAVSSIINQNQYAETLRKVKEHIQKGDCYELNYCRQFFAKAADINPLDLYRALDSLSPNPFSACYRVNGSYCICASPERFILKEGARVFSQPMKGTAPRHSDTVEDARLKAALAESAKNRSENVMIVDLVRNDLSTFARRGSVHVPSVFEVRSYPHVHQMISTITCEVDDAVHWTDIIRNTFPMGSMTGAPKRRVAQLIDEYETGSRELFSGSIGYVDPSGDFDFNVVIRSVFYNRFSSSLTFWAGGGITHKSDIQEEYEETQLKAAAIIWILSGS